VRIIAATSQDLTALMDARTFRADLYYRIAVLEINVPPLRERLEDIEPLCERLLEETPRAENMRGWIIEPEAIAALTSHHWPGNVRELRNVLERAAAIAPTEVLSAEIIARALPRNVMRPQSTTFLPTESSRLADSRARAERQAILDALMRADGKRTLAARLLGVSRSQFYEKLKRYDLSD
jgi:transcriptional regulator with PAS, ATPase and Fis domain